ncbi:MAG: cyclodeaminase/cyclohydrolase family protein [Lachnospiraceae bacterium]|nr:cyclodeaminase/cyclohydrolase family protein [Lachnospiraceae bacterium]
MGKLIDMTVTDFTQLTSSDAPAPGGGSISALAGSLAASLEEMVARLTIGREKYATSEEDMIKVRDEAMVIKEELLAAVDKDTESFNQYMDALKLPKNTDEEKAARRAAMQEGLKAAALVPVAAAEAAVKIIPLAKIAVEKGNANAVTDALVGCMMARTAVLGTALNCRINLASIKDEAFTAELAKKVDGLIAQAIAGEKEVFAATELTSDF